MQYKILEVRDEGTHIPVLAIKVQAENEVQDYYVHGRCGFPSDGRGVIVMQLNGCRATHDPYEWPRMGFGTRTMPNAHSYIKEHWGSLNDGDVVDVQVILGETSAPVVSERLRRMAML